MALGQPPDSNVHPMTLAPLAKVDKPARPPHVILLSDLITRLQGIEKLEALVVAWSVRDEDDFIRIGANCLGNASSTHFLASRVAGQILNGETTFRDAPHE